MRKGKGYDLASVRQISNNFLITGHGCVETNLTHANGFSAKTLSLKDGAVV
jgi:hypothetical protein